MPPDVRRTYEAALRTLGPALAGHKHSDTTEVIRDPAGRGVQQTIVIRKTTTGSDRAHKSVDEFRQLVEGAIQEQGKTGDTPATPDPNMVVEAGRPNILVDYGRTPPLKPFSLE